MGALKRVIGAGKDKITRTYLGRKECKKGLLLGELLASIVHTLTFARTMQQFLRYKLRVQMLAEKANETEQVASTITALRELFQEQTHINISDHGPRIFD